MSTIEQIRQTAANLRAELASPDAPPPTIEEARALAEAAIGLVEENARLRAVAESARSLVAAADACDREAERHPSSRSSAPVVRSINAMARLRQALGGVEPALSGRHAGAKVDASASPESDTDQFTRGLGTAPTAERKPVAGWEVGHVPGYSARRAAPILRRGPICVRATESGWEMIAESDEDDVESIQITSDSAASLEAAQLAAEDALRAIADRIYTALRGER